MSKNVVRAGGMETESKNNSYIYLQSGQLQKRFH